MLVMTRLLAVLAVAALSAAPVEGAVKSISVMTWNMMQFPDNVGPDVFAWDQKPRADRMVDAILAVSPRPDVIAFQEVLNEAARDALDDSKLTNVYPYKTEILGSTCSGLSGLWEKVNGRCPKVDFTQLVSSGTTLISRYPIASTGALFFDSHAAFTADSFAVKGAIYAEIAVESKYRVHVVTTHLQSDSPLWGDGDTADTHTVRMEQLREINAFITDQNLPTNEPVIIMGDLNVRNTETARYNEMLSVAEATSSISDPAGNGTVSCQANWVSNWFTEKYNSGSECSKGYILDYILLKTGYLQPTVASSARVVPLRFDPKIEWKGDAKLDRDGGMYNDLSDHYALEQTFTFDLQEGSTVTGGASSIGAPLLALSACVAALLAKFVF